MVGHDSMDTLAQVAGAAQTGSYDRLSYADACWAYGRCARALSPRHMADAVQRYCERISSVERTAPVSLFHEGFERVTDPRVRLWLRVDPRQASAAQVAQMHSIAQQRCPKLLDRLFGPAGARNGPAARRALAGIAAEAARAGLGP